MSENFLNVMKTPNKETNKNKLTKSFVQLCGLPTCVFIYDSVQIHYNAIKYNTMLYLLMMVQEAE